MKPGEKKCSKCQRDYPLHRFHKSKNGYCGRAAWCKECMRYDGKISGPPIPMTKAEQRENFAEAVESGRIHPHYFQGRHTGDYECGICGIRSHDPDIDDTCCRPGLVHYKTLRGAGIIAGNIITDTVSRIWREVRDREDRDQALARRLREVAEQYRRSHGEGAAPELEHPGVTDTAEEDPGEREVLIDDLIE
jgi:hypothetical protein